MRRTHSNEGESKLMICWLTINRSCNMRCGWCYAKSDGFNASDTMTLETLHRILNVIASQQISRFILLGGEPTLHPHLPEIIQRLKPTKTVLVTNALRLSDRNYLTILKKSGLDVVTISLKGATEQEYLENTGSAGLGRVEQAIANLNELAIAYSISVTFTNSLMETLPAVIDLMKRAGAGVMSINYCRPIVSGDTILRTDLPDPREMARATMESYEDIRASGLTSELFAS